MFLNRKLGTIAAFWGLTGALTILAYAVVRMTRHASEAFTYDLGIVHYLALVGFAGFMAYSEGYKGFQKGYSPRVASRALYLRDRSTMLRLLLAPLFCMGFFHAPRKRRIVVVVLLLGIALIVVLFQFIPQPWRGVLDVGVIVGLSWGIIATLVYFAKFWRAETIDFDAEVIEPS